MTNQMQDVPVFDHEGEVSVIESSKTRLIMQGGHTFSFASFNRETGKYEPTPRYIPPGRTSFDEMKTMCELLLLAVDRMTSSTKELTKVILQNMDLFEEQRAAAGDGDGKRGPGRPKGT